MATARSIVTLALKKLGRVGSGREPRASDAQDGLEALIALYRGWINSGAFGPLCDVIPSGEYVAIGNQRILRLSGEPLNVILPEVVAAYDAGVRLYIGTIVRILADGATALELAKPLTFHARTPEDLAPVVICDADTGNTAEWIYDGAQKKWVPLWNVAIDDEAPLSYRNSDGLASCLAINISDQFGADVSPATAMSANNFRAALVSGFSNPRREAVGVYV